MAPHTEHSGSRIDLATLRRMKTAAAKIAMLTAYDYPTAARAEAAGVHSLLVGDSMGTVLLGHENTRSVPLDLMVVLAEAVRRGAPRVFLVGDMPFGEMADVARTLRAARRFRDEARCDAVKLEVAQHDAAAVERIAAAGIAVIAHLGLRPQQVLTPDGYRAQARDDASITALVSDARRMVSAGAALLLLEAVPNEAAAAVVAAVDVPVIGCGAGPACDGHVVVTQDMLGESGVRPPRFVPVLAQLGAAAEEAMRRYVGDVASGAYPAAQHTYPMRSTPARAVNQP